MVSGPFCLSKHASERVFERAHVSGGQVLEYLESNACVWLPLFKNSYARYALLYTALVEQFLVAVVVREENVLKTVLTQAQWEAQTGVAVPSIFLVLAKMAAAQALAGPGSESQPAPSTAQSETPLSSGPSVPAKPRLKKKQTAEGVVHVLARTRNADGSSQLHDVGTLGLADLLRCGVPANSLECQLTPGHVRSVLDRRTTQFVPWLTERLALMDPGVVGRIMRFSVSDDPAGATPVMRRLVDLTDVVERRLSEPAKPALPPASDRPVREPNRLALLTGFEMPMTFTKAVRRTTPVLGWAADIEDGVSKVLSSSDLVPTSVDDLRDFGVFMPRAGVRPGEREAAPCPKAATAESSAATP